MLRILTYLWIYLSSCFKRTVPESEQKSAHDPYARRLNKTLQVLMPKEDGTYESAESEVQWASVSRHGLLQQGITCPLCGLLVARTGDFAQIHETRYGEAIHCGGCKTVLLASPDDDVDPIAPGSRYDEEIYHRFALTSPARPMQRIRSKPPAPGD